MYIIMQDYILNKRNKWLTIALINLAVVASLGVVLRSKILFSMPWIDFKFILNAHSHFAFAGWITICLFTLMTYEILPEKVSARPVYPYLLTGLLLTAVGMLLSFPLEGYGLFSIIFSTLFIFVTYAFSWVLVKDILKSTVNKSVQLLCVISLIALCVSSLGPFTLAYMMATHSTNVLLYRDAIYSYLHLQYNGFFMLGIFALFINHFIYKCDAGAQVKAKRFAIALSLSLLPTLFLSYLWHYPNAAVRTVAILGCILLVVVLVLFRILIRALPQIIGEINPFAKVIGALSMFAFMLKTTLQLGTVFPAIGNEVFSNRAVIIGYLHLVMLGFVTLYLLAYLVQIKYFHIGNRLTKTGIIVFVAAVIINELILMTQGMAEMMMKNSLLYPWLLLGAAIGLLAGAAAISIAAIISSKAKHPSMHVLPT